MISSTPDLRNASCPAVSLMRRNAGPNQPVGRGTSVSAFGHRHEVLSGVAYAGLLDEPSKSGLGRLSYGDRSSKVEGDLTRSINPIRPSIADVPALIQGALSGVRAWRPPV